MTRGSNDRPRFYRGLALRSSSGPHSPDTKKATSVAVGPSVFGISDRQHDADFNRRSQMVKYATAIRLGTAETEAILGV